MSGIFLGIGGNVGDRLKLLQNVCVLIAAQIGPIIKASSVYETEAWGETEQASFYNQVVQVQTKLNPQELLKICLKIEKQLGRTRAKKWSARTMDIDILFYNNELIHEAGLHIPHPFLQERNFVLVPMAEIAPHHIHPLLRKKMMTLLAHSTDTLTAKKVITQSKLDTK